MLVRAAVALFLVLIACRPLAWADEMRSLPLGSAGARKAVREVDRGVAASVETAAVLALDLGSTEILRTTRPARTIIVGDPGVVEATLTNENTILLVPRGNGTTNLILLDEDGDEFLRRTIRVGPTSKPILVYGGEQVRRYLCEPACNLPPEPNAQPTTIYTTNINGIPTASGTGPAPPGTPAPGAPGAPATGPAAGAGAPQTPAAAPR